MRLKSYGDRAFSVAAPKLWNEIPSFIKFSPSVDVFKSRLKTHLFRLAFNSLVVSVPDVGDLVEVILAPVIIYFNIVLQRGYHHARRPNKMNKLKRK